MSKTANKSELYIEQILKSRKAGFDFTLERVRELMKILGDPQHELKNIIHIAGTNGKGSNTALVRSILQSAGLKTASYTSPHLVNWYERINLSSDNFLPNYISDNKFYEILKFVNEKAAPNITLFEILTACAFIAFKDDKAQACIFEVGLGGRLDATNVIDKPACSIITPISLDHCHILGDSLEKIALEKAGIIKPNCPLVVGPQQPIVNQTLYKIAQSQNAPVYFYGFDYEAHAHDDHFIYHDREQNFVLPLPNLFGLHQIENCASAIKAARIIKPDITQEQISKAIKATYWPGRLQYIQEGKFYDKYHEIFDLWIDGAHNPHGAQILAKFFEGKKLFIINSMLNTKDAQSFYQNLSPIIGKGYICKISSSPSAQDPNILCNIANKVMCADNNVARFFPASSLKDAFKMVAKDCENYNKFYQEQLIIDYQKPIVLLTGSLHLVGDFLALNGTEPGKICAKK